MTGSWGVMKWADTAVWSVDCGESESVGERESLAAWEAYWVCGLDGIVDREFGGGGSCGQGLVLCGKGEWSRRR